MDFCRKSPSRTATPWRWLARTTSTPRSNTTEKGAEYAKPNSLCDGSRDPAGRLDRRAAEFDGGDHEGSEHGFRASRLQRNLGVFDRPARRSIEKGGGREDLLCGRGPERTDAGENARAGRAAVHGGSFLQAGATDEGEISARPRSEARQGLLLRQAGCATHRFAAPDHYLAQ